MMCLAPALGGTGRLTAVCRKRLNKTLAHMRERIYGKLGNRNDNAFKLRKLFAMYDTQRTGKVRWRGICRGNSVTTHWKVDSCALRTVHGGCGVVDIL